LFIPIMFMSSAYPVNCTDLQNIVCSTSTEVYHIIYSSATVKRVGRVDQSVWRLATGWTVRGSKPGGGEIFRTRPDRFWGPPSLI
jgi:hypothetical protein